MLKVKLKLSNGESVYDEQADQTTLIDQIAKVENGEYYLTIRHGQIVYVNPAHIVTIKAFEKETDRDF